MQLIIFAIIIEFSSRRYLSSNPQRTVPLIFFNISPNQFSKGTLKRSFPKHYYLSLIAVLELKLSTDRYINSAATRRGDSYSRGRIGEYTVTTQRATNCKASTTVVRASQIICASDNVTWHTRPLAARWYARSLRGFASSRARTWPRACARRSCADYSRVCTTLFSLGALLGT